MKRVKHETRLSCYHDLRRLLHVAAVMFLFATAIAIAPAQAQQTSTSELPLIEVDKKSAWLASKDNGGTLVIWYDARHKWDADRLVFALRDRGIKNVIGLAGRTDEKFQLMTGGRMDRTLYDVEDSRSGRLGANAVFMTEERGI